MNCSYYICTRITHHLAECANDVLLAFLLKNKLSSHLPHVPFLTLSLSLFCTRDFYFLCLFIIIIFMSQSRVIPAAEYICFCAWKTVRPFVRRPDEPMGKATMGGGGRTSAWFGTRCMRAFFPVAKLPSARDKLLIESFRRKNNDFNGKTTRRTTTADFVRSLIILQAALKYRKNEFVEKFISVYYTMFIRMLE